MNHLTFFRIAGFTSLSLLFANIGPAQTGSVNFANDFSCKVTNSQTTLPADNGTVALYWAPTNSSSFVQIGAGTPLGNPVAGCFAGGTRYTPEAGGLPGQFQVRAWMGASTNYEQAAAVAGTLVGTSAVLQVTTGNPLGDPPTPPASLVAAGLQSFTLYPASPSSPALTLTCASNKTVVCGSAWSFDPPTTNGGCAAITVTIQSTVTNGTCPWSITRTWRAADGCTTNTCSQTVTVTDTAPPVITCASNKTVECGPPWTFDAPTAADECGLYSVVQLYTLTNSGCGNTLTATRTWLATDVCGNTNSCSQTVTVVDTAAPEIVCATNEVVECGQPWSFTPPAVSDACGTNSLVLVSTVTNAACGNAFTAIRTWLATDACGNAAQCSQTITVMDTTPPVLACASNKLALCGAEWAFDEPTASDACGGTNLAVAILTVTNSVCPLVVTRSWAAVDDCGNSNTCSQTVTATSALPPTLTCATNKLVTCTNEWSFDPPDAFDHCGGTNVSVEIVSTVTNSLCPLSLSRSWRATNDCNPVGAMCSQTVTVLCPSCPVLALTKSCPAYPVPPGGTLAWTGTITNGGDIVVSNVIVWNDQPTPNTPVFGPVTLLPGEGTSFSGSYSVPACSCGPHVDTLTASGTGLDGIIFTGSATASCVGTNRITPGDMNGDGIVSQSELNDVLANYWAHSEWVTMTNAALLCDGRFQFSLTNAGAWGFTVLVSTNLVDWTNLPAPAIPVFQFTDPEGTNAPQRLYRLQWP